MAVVVGSKQLARIEGEDALGRITEVMLSVPEGDDNVAAVARHMLDALNLGAVVEAESGGRRLLISRPGALVKLGRTSSGRSCRTMGGSS